MVKTYSFETLGLLDETMDESFVKIVGLAAKGLETRFSLISILDERQGRQFVSAECGNLFDEPGACNISIKDSICRHVKDAGSSIAINDLLEDPRTSNNQVVLSNDLRAYIGSPIHALNGKIIGALCCMTENPRTWTDDDLATLEALAALVDEIVKARGAALNEHNLNQELSNLLKTRSKYIQQVAHEIRTPLTGIIASISMLEAADLSAHSSKLVKILSRSSDRLLNFVTYMLDLTKADLIDPSAKDQRVNLRTLVQKVAKPFRSLATVKSIDMIIEDRLHDRIFLADQDALETILRHLIGNAFKFTHSGSVTVRLREDNYGQVLIELKDTGIGIDKEMQQGIFQEFTRAQDTTAGAYGGHGLGLAIVKRITDRVHGQITVESELGEGTTISVMIPLTEVPTSVQ